MPQDPLSLSGRAWRWPTVQVPNPCPDHPHEAPFVAHLLTQRGIDDSARASFMAPSLKDMLNPAEMAHMGQAVERLLSARAHDEEVLIWGDYDVDGVCATAILMAFLRQIGMRCAFYIPDRRSEGYGLNTAGVTQLAQTGRRLLVTVDCGSTSHAEIAAARALGLDTIVVDHHQVADALPEAVACINPKRSDCSYADKGLCAAGLAFMLVVDLRRTMRERGLFSAGLKEPDVRPLLDMVAVATVADMVPLTGVNRLLVHAGLKRLREAPRPGLRALCEVAKLDLAHIGAQDLGFRLGPRINARGRMEHAGMAVDLMLTEDPQQARQMAELLDEANRARRTLEKETVDAALHKVQAEQLTDDAVLVVADPVWHAGVLGLVASRLMHRFHRPAVVIGEAGKGSARSVAGINLHACLQQSAPLMQRFGGHPAAAGLTIDPENVAPLREALSAQVRALMGPPPFVPELKPDLEVLGPYLTPALWAQLIRLAPFGQANPEPLLAAMRQPIIDRRIVGEDHLKLRLGERGYDAIAFGMAPLMPLLGSHVDVLFYLDENRYRGETRLQMRVHDLRVSAAA